MSWTFLSHTKNFSGLLNEILGNNSGVCGGIGGSQHLFYKKFFILTGFWVETPPWPPD